MEKEVQSREKIQPLSPLSDDSSDRGRTTPKDPKWQPGFVKRFPWVRFGAVLMVLVCAAASVAVLVTSNLQSPIGVEVANCDCAEGADQHHQQHREHLFPGGNRCGNGIAIAWWRKTLKGLSIADLSRSWAFRTSLSEIVFSLRYFNVIALAALAAKLTLVDSSLMQRATGTYLGMEKPQNISNVAGYVNLTFPVPGTVAGIQ